MCIKSVVITEIHRTNSVSAQLATCQRLNENSDLVENVRKQVDLLKSGKSEEEVEETVIESTETDQEEIIEEVEVVEEELAEEVPFAIIEEVPTFPGCEKLAKS